MTIRPLYTDTKFWILYYLCDKGGSLCQNRFCENWCYSKQTVNTAVAALEREGIVLLNFKEGSRKQKEIRLTDTGEKFCRRYIVPVLKAEEESLMKLDEKERSVFLKTIARLLDSLEEKIQS